jgi:hypothetical protein
VNANLPSLAHLAPDNAAGDDPTTMWAEYAGIVKDAIAGDPRSLQTRIGPSGLGVDCDRCLAHQLAGIPEHRDDDWLPTVGRAVHAWLEEVFTTYNADLPSVRFLTETRVSVGEVDGTDITGNADLYDLWTATVADYKIVGATTLKTARRGPSPTYRRQLHLYGRGFARRGLTPQRVAIWYLPRNATSLDHGVQWSEPYDEQIALDTLARADAFARAIRLAGPDAVLASLPVTQGCHSCARYPLPDGTVPPRPGHHPGSDLAGLVPSQTPDTTGAGSTAA